jgi:hypothetical protein
LQKDIPDGFSIFCSSWEKKAVFAHCAQRSPNHEKNKKKLKEEKLMTEPIPNKNYCQICKVKFEKGDYLKHIKSKEHKYFLDLNKKKLQLIKNSFVRINNLFGDSIKAKNKQMNVNFSKNKFGTQVNNTFSTELSQVTMPTTNLCEKKKLKEKGEQNKNINLDNKNNKKIGKNELIECTKVLESLRLKSNKVLKKKRASYVLRLMYDIKNNNRNLSNASIIISNLK